MSITVINCHQVKNWALSPRKCCAVILPCSRLISVAMWCPLNFGEKAPVLGFFFFSFFKGCVVVCHPSVSVELHLSLCGLLCYLEGTVVQCRRWKPCDSSRICVAVVNPSPSPPFFSPWYAGTSVILCILPPRLFSIENVMGTSLYEESCCM